MTNGVNQPEPGFVQKYLKYLAVPPGYKKLLHLLGNLRKGHNLLTDEWDLCVILDACRADILVDVLNSEWTPPNEWTLETITSVDSATEPWAIDTFTADDAQKVEPVTYVSSNPYSTAVQDSPAIDTLDEVWRYGWDSDLRVVPPSTITDRTVHHYRNDSNRVMAHYLQPHTPHLRREQGGLSRHYELDIRPSSNEEVLKARWQDRDPADRDNILHRNLPGNWELPSTDTGNMWNRLRWGDLSHREVWESYRETLLIVLDEVETLLQSVDAETVLVTADHGEAFGEWGLYSHPYNMPFSVLREVPYLMTCARREIDYQPKDYDTSSLGNRQEQLRALGYY